MQANEDACNHAYSRHACKRNRAAEQVGVMYERNLIFLIQRGFRTDVRSRLSRAVLVQPEGSTSACASGGVVSEQDKEDDERVLEDCADGYLRVTLSSINPAQMARPGCTVLEVFPAAVRDLPQGTGPFR